LPIGDAGRFLMRNRFCPFGKTAVQERARQRFGGRSVGAVVLGFVAVIVFIIALGWLAIVSRPK
jgi:uncharacterized membrane protein YccF (DUF307 family)